MAAVNIKCKSPFNYSRFLEQMTDLMGSFAEG
jgi:hypothetical protein